MKTPPIVHDSTTNSPTTAGENELDLLLGELSALEKHLQSELTSLPSGKKVSEVISSTPEGATIVQINPQPSPVVTKGPPPAIPKKPVVPLDFDTPTNTESPMKGCSTGSDLLEWPTKPLPKKPLNLPDVTQCQSTVSPLEKARSDSPGADSAFSDNVSLLSSDSSASCSAVGGGVKDTDTARVPLMVTTPQKQHNKTEHTTQRSRADVSQTQTVDDNNDGAAQGVARADAVRHALKKMQVANVKKLYVKIYAADESTKSVLLDETMNAASVAIMMADKKHVVADTEWSIVERLPKFSLERTYEEHERVVENIMQWNSEDGNRLVFLRRPSKHDLFVRPEKYLLDSCRVDEQDTTFQLDDSSRDRLIQEKMMSGVTSPSLEGSLWLKVDGKKSWKRHVFVLRASAIYYSPKDKPVTEAKNLVCLGSFERNQIYTSFGWKEKLKAPSEFGIALKNGQSQTGGCKNISYLCAQNEYEWRRWLTAFRLAKYGRQLADNYQQLLSLLADIGCGPSTERSSCGLQSVIVSGLPNSCARGKLPDRPKHSVPAAPAQPPAPPRRVRFSDSPEVQTSQRLTLARSRGFPPPEFLGQLCSVIQRRSIVAEKCRINKQLPHQVLGCPDDTDTGEPSAKEAQVGHWLRQHYGEQNQPTQLQSILKRPAPKPTMFN